MSNFTNLYGRFITLTTGGIGLLGSGVYYFNKINNRLYKIENNHLYHIEQDTSNINYTQELMNTHVSNIDKTITNIHNDIREMRKENNETRREILNKINELNSSQ